MKNKLKHYALAFFNSYVWLIALLIVIDQVTKAYALRDLWNVTVIPNFFYLEYVRNTGAAWSMFSDNMVLLALISAAVALGLIVYLIYKRKEINVFLKITLSVLLAGTLGNFIDRAFYKALTGTEGVVDFLKFDLGPFGVFPTFNVADMCVTISIFMLMGYLIYDEIKAKKAEKNKEEDETHSSK